MLTERRKTNVIQLCQSLVRLKSYSGEEDLAAKEIKHYAEQNGFDDVIVDELGNVILVMKGNTEGPTVLLDGHIDTVPVNADRWTSDPFSGELKDGKIYGRGTSDMKGAVSAMICAAVNFAEDTGKKFSGKVVVSCSVHEECFEGVATRRVSEIVNPDFVVIGEATDLKLNRGQRGRAEVVVETIGKPAHSSNPEKGNNAVYQMMKLISGIRNLPIIEHDILGKGILELTDIKSSPYPGASVVPSLCTATFDRRLLVGETKESVLAPIQSLIEKLESENPEFEATVKYAFGKERCYTGASIQDERFFPGWLFHDEEDFVQLPLKELVAIGLHSELSHYSFCTNGSHFAGEVNIPTIGFGPSLESQAHVDNEYIEIDQLVKAAAGYAAIIKALTSLELKKKETADHV
ncbi:YgeY family selenium metabolism-linked hydrolase [Bacillus sp. DTU_2020_1000418_1_SI_GHA_SEK_038]|uniref:YgeY family selenium metabolism-linked hydrolase n=1 Tax=Bacillus sp. DTU_2020_1000418_1_SI_GHA_SEK_038 TaxID=3077585 RepID=UPI0028E2A3D0|nr:YgeY family selenium metabolism-linked hydrolase [Bacillus sp. DTU_2020_1000418_1_SI_GHA_SEK_038]WNS76458.1 YgeY family selenium metabolism-linked hydrolase [Bacillus sp. DTU_2020_1000418_1_SI_GHA_SEK_038]